MLRKFFMFLIIPTLTLFLSACEIASESGGDVDLAPFNKADLKGTWSSGCEDLSPHSQERILQYDDDQLIYTRNYYWNDNACAPANLSMTVSGTAEFEVTRYPTLNANTIYASYKFVSATMTAHTTNTANVFNFARYCNPPNPAPMDVVWGTNPALGVAFDILSEPDCPEAENHFRNDLMEMKNGKLKLGTHAFYLPGTMDNYNRSTTTDDTAEFSKQ